MHSTQVLNKNAQQLWSLFEQMLTIFENKHNIGLGSVIWLFVVLKVLEEKLLYILGEYSLQYITNLITVNSGQFKISES